MGILITRNGDLDNMTHSTSIILTSIVGKLRHTDVYVKTVTG